jgi:hypothetical protein
MMTMHRHLPEIAFVTDIRGECNAGATPQTTLYPIIPANPNVKKLLINAGPASFPSATAEPIPAVIVATSRLAFCHGVIATTSGSLLVTGAATGGGAGRGAAGRTSPLCATIDPRTTSSLRSTANRPSPPMESKNFVMLLEYSVDD